MNSLSTRKIIRSFSVYFLSITIISVLTSCANDIAKLPPAWGKNTQGLVDGCTDISGVYRNEGMDAPDNKNKASHQKYPQYLSKFLVASLLVSGRKHKWITHIELVGVKQGKLIALIKKQDKTIYTEVLKQGQDFTCIPDGIEITSSYTKIYDTGGAGRQTSSLVFNKSNDGSLLVREGEKEKGVGLLILIPIPYATSTTQYYKFPSMDNLP